MVILEWDSRVDGIWFEIGILKWSLVFEVLELVF